MTLHAPPKMAPFTLSSHCFSKTSIAAQHEIQALRCGTSVARKDDGEPGAQTLWKGLQRLDDITDMFRIMREMANPGRPPP